METESAHYDRSGATSAASRLPPLFYRRESGESGAIHVGGSGDAGVVTSVGRSGDNGDSCFTAGAASRSGLAQKDRSPISESLRYVVYEVR